MKPSEVKEISFSEAVAELVHLSGWPRKDVIADPHSAYWQASAFVAKCKNIVAAGEHK